MTVDMTAKRPVYSAKRRRLTARPDSIAAWQRFMAPLPKAPECPDRCHGAKRDRVAAYSRSPPFCPHSGGGVD
jgi:hypothetical protein